MKRAIKRAMSREGRKEERELVGITEGGKEGESYEAERGRERGRASVVR